jgi:LuxR family transcriptional regulator, maltose regulon positive regulatory protein
MRSSQPQTPATVRAHTTTAPDSPPAPGPDRDTRLAAILDDAVDRPAAVVLVSAPSGTGKSEMLARWAARRRDLQTLDIAVTPPGHVGRLWRACVERFDAAPMTGPSTPEAGRVPGSVEFADDARRAEHALAQAAGRVVLVVDDADLLALGVDLFSVQTFLTNQAPHVAVIISARHDIPLPWHVYAAEHRFTRIGEAQLSMTSVEIRRLLTDQQTELSDAQAERLRTLTGGWPSLVGIAADHLAGRPRVDEALAQLERSPQPVADHLVGEVLARLTPELLAFAAVTAVPPTFDADLAEHLCECDADGAIRGLVRCGFPILTDALSDAPDRSPVYRYPGILRTHLRAEMRRRDRAAPASVLLRAIEWSMSRGRDLDALRGALLLADPEVLEDILSQVGPRLILDDRGDAIAPLLEQACASIPNRPIVLLLRAMIALDADDVAAAIASVEHAEVARSSLHRDPPSDVIAALYHILVLQISTRAPFRDARSAREVLRDLPARTSADVRVLASMVAAAAGLGDPDEADTLLAHAMAIAASGDLPMMRVRVREQLSSLAAHRGEPLLQKHWARDALDTALAAGRVDGDVVGRCRAFELDARYQLGERLDAVEVDDIRRRLDTADPAWTAVVRRAPVMVLTATFDYATDRHASADLARRTLIRVMRSRQSSCPSPVMLVRVAGMCADSGLAESIPELAAVGEGMFGQVPEVAVARGIGALVCRGPDQARRIFAPVITDLNGAHPETAMTGWVVHARIAAGLDDRRECHRGLDEAMRLGAPRGLMAPLLAGARTIADAVARDVGTFGHVESFAAAYLAVARDRWSPRQVHLTVSEMRVLTFLPSGQTAEEIADVLSVSVNTVKTHMRNIYRKLGVGARRDAVSAARTAGLL